MTTLRSPFIAGVAAAFLTGGLLTPAVLGAQSPWKVTVTPTLNPLPIGFCGAVRLDLIDPATRDTPRNPAGARVTMADFDMAVTTPDGKSVAGEQVDASHWSVCACQGAAIGTVATITASYPAQALSERARVPGVKVQSTATVTFTANKGTGNPPVCQAPAPPVIAQTVPLPPSAAQRSLGSPTGFRLVSSVPIVATLGWDAMPNAVSYALWRADGGSPAVKRTTISPPAANTTTDIIPDPRVLYRYTLVVQYADGKSAESPAVDFTSPPLVNPPGFTAKHSGMGTVDFQWQAVPGAVQYRVDGSGIPGTGHYTTSTSTSYPNIPPGASSWKLTALYQGNYADYANASTAATVIRVLPPHPQPWLSKNTGSGTAAPALAPSQLFNPAYPGTCLFRTGATYGMLELYGTGAKARWLGENGFCSAPEDLRIGLQWWLNQDLPLWGDPLQFGNEAVYGNAVDLGVGRRAYCMQGGPGLGRPAFGLVTTCYATAHGIVPGEPGFNDFGTITNPGGGMGNDFILSMVITKDARGSVFLVFIRDFLLPYGGVAKTVSLDTEGPKLIPGVCMACHGGKYNPKTLRVDGASFLPLDPGLLEFASPAHKAAQEEKIRKVNFAIAMSDPTSAVAEYIRGLYGNGFAVPGTVATPDYVPAGWAPQAGFYRSVVKPYCAMCHLAAPPSWNFASWQNFQDNAALIKASVCSAHTMPHSELQFTAFWTKDTGPVYTPGLLAATLGYPSCP